MKNVFQININNIDKRQEKKQQTIPFIAIKFYKKKILTCGISQFRQFPFSD